MICESCGKQNEAGAFSCAFCGASMPPAQAGNGFADILFASGTTGQSGMPSTTADDFQTEIRKINAYHNRLERTQGMLNKRLKVASIAALLGLAIAVGSIAICLFSRNNTNPASSEVNETVEVLQKTVSKGEFDELAVQIKSLQSKLLDLEAKVSKTESSTEEETKKDEQDSLITGSEKSDETTKLPAPPGDPEENAPGNGKQSNDQTNPNPCV